MLPLGDTRIELLEPIAEDSTIGRFLAKRGQGPHHLAIRLAGIDAVFDRLRAQGVRLASDRIRIGAGGHRYFFIHPASTGGVLLELLAIRTRQLSRATRRRPVPHEDPADRYLRRDRQRRAGRHWRRSCRADGSHNCRPFGIRTTAARNSGTRHRAPHSAAVAGRGGHCARPRLIYRGARWIERGEGIVRGLEPAPGCDFPSCGARWPGRVSAFHARQRTAGCRARRVLFGGLSWRNLPARSNADSRPGPCRGCGSSGFATRADRRGLRTCSG